jgi:hypothetical protein
MSAAPSVLSLFAAGLYAVVAFACLIAWSKGRGWSLPGWHGRIWLALAAFFILLLSMRVTGFEETLRDSARAYLRAQDAFEGRRDTQRLVIAGFLIVGSVLGMWLFYKMVRGSKGKPDIAAKLASLGGLSMLGLLTLRFVSLHAIDRILYGPLKLNWVIDVGASCAVLFAAGYYVQLTRDVSKKSRR